MSSVLEGLHTGQATPCKSCIGGKVAAAARPGKKPCCCSCQEQLREPKNEALLLCTPGGRLVVCNTAACLPSDDQCYVQF